MNFMNKDTHYGIINEIHNIIQSRYRINIHEQNIDIKKIVFEFMELITHKKEYTHITEFRKSVINSVMNLLKERYNGILTRNAPFVADDYLRNTQQHNFKNNNNTDTQYQSAIQERNNNTVIPQIPDFINTVESRDEDFNVQAKLAELEKQREMQDNNALFQTSPLQNTSLNLSMQNGISTPLINDAVTTPLEDNDFITSFDNETIIPQPIPKNIIEILTINLMGNGNVFKYEIQPILIQVIHIQLLNVYIEGETSWGYMKFNNFNNCNVNTQAQQRVFAIIHPNKVYHENIECIPPLQQFSNIELKFLGFKKIKKWIVQFKFQYLVQE